MLNLSESMDISSFQPGGVPFMKQIALSEMAAFGIQQTLLKLNFTHSNLYFVKLENFNSNILFIYFT